MADVDDNLKNKLDSVNYFEGVFSTVGTSKRREVARYTKGNMNYRLLNVGTSVDVKLQGTYNGTTWVDIQTANQTSNGNYRFEWSDSGLVYVRFNLVTITGGSPDLVVHTHMERPNTGQIQTPGDDVLREGEFIEFHAVGNTADGEDGNYRHKLTATGLQIQKLIAGVWTPLEEV